MNAYGIAHVIAPSPVVWLAAAAVGGLGAQLWRRRGGHVLAATALGAVGFQILHVTEHLLQLGYWTLHPQQPPWLTPWAVAGRDALAHAAGVAASGGNELLHLGGNVGFFAGLAALAVLARRHGVARQLHALRPAMYVQGGHVAEHLLLTGTSLLTGRAIGCQRGVGTTASARLRSGSGG